MERGLADRRVVGGRAEGVVVRDERVHPVDRDELLGQRVRDPVVVRDRAGDAADHLAGREAAEEVVQLLAREAPPVRAQGDLRRRVADHRRRPLDRVDLGDQGGVDQARPLEEVVVRPRRVLGSQPVADRVVLADEDHLHQRDPEPEARHLRRVELLLLRDRQEPVLADPQLAVLARAQEPLQLERAAVELRRVPPVRLGVDVRGRELVAVRRPRRVRRRARDLHRPLRPWVVVFEADRPHVARVAPAVAEPVADHELEPRCDERVHRRRRLERVARQQLAADHARVRLQEARLGLAGTSARSGRCGRSAIRPGPSRGRRGRCTSRPPSARSGSERSNGGTGVAFTVGALFVS